MRKIFAAALLAGAMYSSAVYAEDQKPVSGIWTITKSEWTQADEKGFGDFVKAIGHSGCSTTAGATSANMAASMRRP